MLLFYYILHWGFERVVCFDEELNLQSVVTEGFLNGCGLSNPRWID